MTKKQQMTRVLRFAALLGMIVLSATSARAGTIIADSGDQFNLQELMDNEDVIIIGDKKFDMWDYAKQDIPSNNMPNADGVTVIATTINGNLGITFQGGFGDVPGDNGLSDAAIFYRVMVTDDDKWISDAHLEGNLDVVGPLDSTAMISVTERFRTDMGGDKGPQIAQMTISAVQGGGMKELNNLNWVIFDELHKSLFVEKDIIAYASEGISFPIASLIDQTFSQTPEPTTITLLAMAGVTICLTGRRRRHCRS